MSATTVLVAMLPEHLLLAGIVLLLVAEIAGGRDADTLPAGLAVLALAAAAAAWLHLAGYSGTPFPGQLSVDPQSALGKAVVLALAWPALLMSRGDFTDARFPTLVLSSLYGVCVLLSADGFLALFIGIELMSLPVYALILLAFRRPDSLEAALKYLVLGGAGSATLLLGISLLFGATGSLGLDAFAAGLGSGAGMAQAGATLVVAAFFLKAAVVPFHAWAPDAYQGASVPVTAYMATVVKAGVLLAAVRLFGDANAGATLVAALALLPLGSMVWGNLAALRQDGFRRMMAYSSIAHAGYLFFALLGEAAGRQAAVLFYVVAYGLANLLAFACVPAGDDRSRDRLDGLKGLYGRSPYAAIALGVAMLSLAGIPPFPGFVAKFLIFREVLAAGHAGLAVAGLVASYLGIYFYLRVIQYMFMSAPAAEPGNRPARGAALAASLLCLAPFALLTFFPGWLIDRL